MGNALAALTGINPEEVKHRQQRGGCYRTTRDWLTRLRELSQELGHAPTTRESNEGGINAHQLCLRVGGKWVDVLKAAGIDIRSRNKYAILRSTSTEMMIEDVVYISRRLGHIPTLREYKVHGRYSCRAVKNRLGGWRRVKQAVTTKPLNSARATVSEYQTNPFKRSTLLGRL